MRDETAAANAQRRELQRRVFSAESDSADARLAARLLLELEKRLHVEAVERASRLAEASAEREFESASVFESAHPAQSGGALVLEQAPVLDAPASRLGAARSVAAVALALVVGLALGSGFVGEPLDDVAEAPTRPIVDSSGALALFDSLPTGADLPTDSLPGTVITESIRPIGDPFFELYIGRNAANMVCLFAVQPTDSFAMACVTIDEFPSTGIRLEWSSRLESISPDGSTSLVPSTIRAIWRPDGTLDVGGGPR